MYIDHDAYIDGNASVNDQFISLLADGGLPPLNVISKVFNPNVNVEYLGGYRAIEFSRKAENASITGSWTYATAPEITTWGVNPNSAATYGQITALGATVITGSGTAGKIPKFSAARVVTDSSYLSEISGAVKSTASIQIDTPSAGGSIGHYLQTSGVNRWFHGKYQAESGSNTGSNLALSYFSDAGTQLGNVYLVDRATGVLTFQNVVKGVTPVSAADLVTKGFFDARNLTVAGTSGRISVTGGTLTLAADRTWTADLVATGIAAGTYRSTTYDIYGRATAGTNPTTVAGYGITDILAQPLTGYTVGSNTALTAIDTLLGGFGKLQGQLTNINTTGITGTGTSGKFAKFTGTRVVGDSSYMSEVSGAININSNLIIDSASAGGIIGSFYRTSGLERWSLGRYGTEGGSNTGSDFALTYYNDAGASVGNTFLVNRATGILTFQGVVRGVTPVGSTDLVTKGFFDARQITINGTASRITVTGGTQSFLSDRTWTADLAASGVAAGTGTKFVVDTYGRITSIVAATTLSAYGITDAVSASSVAGTTNKVAMFTSSTAIGDSPLSVSSGNVTGSGNIAAINIESNGPHNPAAPVGIFLKNGSSIRWVVGKYGTESGSNAGSDFYFSRYNDAGGHNGDVMVINRATGVTSFNYVVAGQTPTSSSHLTTKGYTDGAFVPLARTVTAGTGMSGGGSLSSNITLNFDTTFGDGRYSLLAHTHTFASLTSKPTTLIGYGITDAYPLTGNPSGFSTASGTTGYFPKFTGASSLGNSAMQDTGSEINIDSSRNFAVEGVAAMRGILNVHNYIGIGKAGQHGAIVIHDVSSATPNSSCAIDIQSTSRGMGFPQMTCTQKTSIMSPKNGIVVYQTDAGVTTAGSSGYGSSQVGAGWYGFWGSTGWVKISFT